MEKALALVEFDCENIQNLKVSETALQEIEGIPKEYGIKTIAGVGPGRIGKSSLLNWFAGKNVFEIGSSTSRVTQGIWMYIDVNHEKRIANIYIDVEGFGDPSKLNVDQNDTRLLNIVIQICDVILYNIKGVYDSDMYDKIKLVCNLFQRYRAGKTALEKPILVSVLRDFDLDLPECPDTEFRNLFKSVPAVLDTFRETKAFTLVKPKEGRTFDLMKTPDEELCTEFVHERNEMEKYLTAKSKPLRAAQNLPISGNVLAENIRKLVKHVNDDDLKMLSKSLPEIFKEKNEVIRKEALDTYKSEMTKRWPGHSTQEILTELHVKQRTAALALIEEKCFEIPGSVIINKEPFREDIEKEFQTMYENKCKDAIESTCSEIKSKCDQRMYFKDGGADEYFKDFENAEKTYKGLNNLGPAQLHTWEAFTEDMDKEKKCIIDFGKVIEDQKEVTKAEEKNKTEASKLEEERKNFNYSKHKFEREQSQESTFHMVLKGASTVVEAVRIVTDVAKMRTRAGSGTKKPKSTCSGMSFVGKK